MNLNNFTLSRWLRLEALIEAKNSKLGMNLRSLLNDRDGCIDIWSRLTAGVLFGSTMAIARHLLAAGHFHLGHLAVWQTSERRCDRPQNQQTHDHYGTDLCHLLMLPPSIRVCKVLPLGSM
jgi:hypothetical protein